MQTTNRTRVYRRAGGTSLGVLGLVLTPAFCLVAAMLLAQSVLVVPWQGPNRIGVAGLETPSSPIWLAPDDDTAGSTTPNVAEETFPFADRESTASPTPLANVGPPTNHGRPGLSDDSTRRPGNETPGKGDEPAPDPVEDMILARVDSSAPTGAIHLESHGASGTTVMALSLASSQPPATCASDRPSRVVVPIRSSDESVATVTPESLSFDCTGSELVTINPAGPGVATVRVGRPTTTPEGMKVDLSGAALTIEVTEAPPPNTEPTVRVPRPVTIEAAGSAGQTFAWKAAGFDREDGELPATCTPAPGSMFPIGSTTVTCAVTDSRGFTDSATFDVTVVDGPISDPDPGDGDGDVPDVDKPYAPSVVLPSAAAVDDRGQWFKDRILMKVIDNGDRIPLEGAPSGVDPRSFPGVILVNEAGRHTISDITVRDRAGNVSNPAPAISFNIDRDVPVVDLLCPGDPVEVGQSPAANWTARDQGSGVATEPAGSVELITNRPGTFWAKVPRGTAVDKVGHVSDAARCRYTVIPTAQPDGEGRTPGNEPTLDATARKADTSTTTDPVEKSSCMDPHHGESVASFEPPSLQRGHPPTSRNGRREEAADQDAADLQSDDEWVENDSDTSEGAPPVIACGG